MSGLEAWTSMEVRLAVFFHSEAEEPRYTVTVVVTLVVDVEFICKSCSPFRWSACTSSSRERLVRKSCLDPGKWVVKLTLRGSSCHSKHSCEEGTEQSFEDLHFVDLHVQAADSLRFGRSRRQDQDGNVGLLGRC